MARTKEIAMKLCNSLLNALFLGTAAQFAFADAGHDHGKNVTFGSAGKEFEITRTIEVQASDDMRFTPGKIEVRQGETIKFVVTNIGRIRHEFSIGDRASQRAHALMMKKMSNMKHEDDPTTVTVEPGQTKAVVWKFDKKPASPLEFACHEPGHYEAGMKMAVVLGK
jgi:uncharacterized cupredoxin-like copper-binding protein